MYRKRQNWKTSTASSQTVKKSAKPVSTKRGRGLKAHFFSRYRCTLWRDFSGGLAEVESDVGGAPGVDASETVRASALVDLDRDMLPPLGCKHSGREPSKVSSPAE